MAGLTGRCQRIKAGKMRKMDELFEFFKFPNHGVRAGSCPHAMLVIPLMNFGKNGVGDD